MILRILVLFSSPFHPRKYPFVAQIVLLLSMLWLMDHLWPSNGHPILLGASDIKWPVSSSRQWWCPTFWEYHPSLCASHPAHKFQGYLGNFHELHWKLPQLSPVDACERQGSRMGETWVPPFSIPGVRTHLLGSTEEVYTWELLMLQNSCCLGNFCFFLKPAVFFAFERFLDFWYVDEFSHVTSSIPFKSTFDEH